MSPKNTLVWLTIAAALFGVTWVYQYQARKAHIGPARIFAGFKASSITAVEVTARNRELEIRAERTNSDGHPGWQLSAPLAYPAQSATIENLLSRLEALTPAAYITERELKNRANADEEYGLTTPQASLTLQPGDYRLRLGKTTAPGDQVFVQLVNGEGIYVVDADLLKVIPKTPDLWRDTSLLNLKTLAFNRIAVTNGATIFVLEREPTNRFWRMVYPIPARADQGRIEESLRKLQALRVQQFVSDDPKAELEPLGLQPAQTVLALAQDTNTVLALHFGKSPTNNENQLYCRRAGQATLGTVSKELISPWLVPAKEFRDPHLVAFSVPVELIEVRGEDSFSVLHDVTNGWRVLPRNVPADTNAVKDLLALLSNTQAELVKELVTEADLPTYGLGTNSRQYVLSSVTTNSPAVTNLTNSVIAQLNFGTNQQEKVFVRRADENSVYAIKLADFQHLPAASWELRDRQMWNLPENDVARVSIRQAGRMRQLIRTAQYKWVLAPGSQGVIEGLREEETVRGLCHLSATAWLGHGEPSRTRYGFTPDGHQITVELKNGEKFALEFGKVSPTTFPYAGVTLDGEFWVFECPLKLCRDVLAYLSIPEVQ